MTPLEFAKSVADDLDTLALPKNRNGNIFYQLGDVIIDCEATWVSATGVSQQELVPGAAHCGVVDMADLQIVAAFNCAITSDDDGLTDEKELIRVAQEQDRIGGILTSYVRDLTAKTIVDSTITGVQYQNTGGLGIVQIGFTTPIP